MKEISFAAGEILFAVIWSAIRASLWIYRKKIDWKRELQLLIMYINLAVIIRYIFYPFPLLNGKVQPLLFDAGRVYPFKLNLVPFVNITDYAIKSDIYINIIGNTVMFIPSGILLPVLYRELDRAWKVIGAGALMSLCIELIQLLFYVRTTDVDDLILNTAGCIAGYLIYVLARSIIRRWHRTELTE